MRYIFILFYRTILQYSSWISVVRLVGLVSVKSLFSLEQSVTLLYKQTKRRLRILSYVFLEQGIIQYTEKFLNFRRSYQKCYSILLKCGICVTYSDGNKNLIKTFSGLGPRLRQEIHFILILGDYRRNGLFFT